MSEINESRYILWISQSSFIGVETSEIRRAIRVGQSFI